jgi:hypothetical protein
MPEYLIIRHLKGCSRCCRLARMRGGDPAEGSARRTVVVGIRKAWRGPGYRREGVRGDWTGGARRDFGEGRGNGASAPHGDGGWACCD